MSGWEKASLGLLGEPAGAVDQTQMLHLHWRQSQFEVPWWTGRIGWPTALGWL